MKTLLLLISSLALFLSCGRELESVTVKSDPLQTVERSDTAVTTSPDDDFIHVKIGEFNPVESLDPLFAESNSEFRVMNLIYDRLTKLDESGEVAPALAKSWQVNRDSSEYTFTLRNDVYFHNVSIFSGGVGRKFTASDVSFVFERMASNNVPDYAADMFQEIKGFKAYHTEQTYIKNTSKRVLDSILGIEVQNDTTVTFALQSPSPNFLRKLAHPYASIYARESVTSTSPPIQRSAGTGVFYFVTREDSSHIFAVNNNYFGEQPELNRLDVISGLSEPDLFQMFVREQLDALVELSPSTITTVVDSSGKLSISYTESNYILKQPDVSSTHSLYFNKASGQHAEVSHLLAQLDTTSIFEQPLFDSIQFYELDTTQNASTENNQLIIANTQNPAELYLINRIAEKAASFGYTVSMSPTFAITEKITLSSRSFLTTHKILDWHSPIFILLQDDISGLELNNEPWNINFSKISVSEESR